MEYDTKVDTKINNNLDKKDSVEAAIQQLDEKSDNYIFGEKVKAIRINAGLTQREVASKLNVTPGFISNIENGRTAMSLRLLLYYASFTGTSLDCLVGLIDSDYETTALDNDIIREIQKLDTDKKKKLLDILKVINRK